MLSLILRVRCDCGSKSFTSFACFRWTSHASDCVGRYFEFFDCILLIFVKDKSLKSGEVLLFLAIVRQNGDKIFEERSSDQPTR